MRTNNLKPYLLPSGKVIGIRLNYFEDVFYFETGKLTTINMCDSCIVSTEAGKFLGNVSTPIRVIADDPEKNFYVYGKVLRIANKEDIARQEENRDLEKTAFQFCNEKMKVHQLKMKLIKTVFRYDRSKVIFFFTADDRVDFRELVKDLTGEFHTRIEMKQIGARDEARIFGGHSRCGRHLCCSAYQKKFVPVSIRMAKIQNLTLDPGKISGVCGRLMCCLEYEYETYNQARKKLPRYGEKVLCNEETGKIVEMDVLRETASVEFSDGRVVRMKVEDIKRIKQKKPVKNTSEES